MIASFITENKTGIIHCDFQHKAEKMVNWIEPSISCRFIKQINNSIAMRNWKEMRRAKETNKVKAKNFGRCNSISILTILFPRYFICWSACYEFSLTHCSNRFLHIYCIKDAVYVCFRYNFTEIFRIHVVALVDIR